MSADTPHSSERESEGRRLDRSLATGLAWTAAAKWAAQLLSWASTLVVARLLAPSDYGIIGMAAVYLGVVQIVSEFGLGTAIIQREDLADDQISQISGLSALIGLAMFGLSVAAAPMLAAFFHESAVRLVVVALATTYIITSLQVVPMALLARGHRFRRLAFIETSEALTSTAVTLGLAFGGAGYWSLVIGNIAGKCMSVVLALSARAHRVAWPRNFSRMRDVLTFGWQVVLARLTWYGYSNADFVIIGRMLGKAALGAYTFGWSIASLPVDKITGILARVTIPVFAAVQHDNASLQRYLVRMSEALVVVVLPASIGLALVSHDFVQAFLGDRWAAATLPLQLLSVHVTVRCVNALFGQVLLAIGDARQSMRVGIWLIVIMPALFYVGAKLWGPPGVALMWLVGHPVVTFPTLIAYTSRRIEMPLGRLAEAFVPPLVGTMAMALAVVAVSALLAKETHVGVRLAVSIASGACAYPAVMWIVYRERMRNLIGTLAHLRS